MRGLRLFVRPIEPGDDPVLRDFLARNRGSAAAPCDPPHSGTPAWGLLGKLLGDVVAVVASSSDGDSLRIDEIVVARELRRKWIGRVMVRETAALAAKLDHRRVVVDQAHGADEFYRRVGFATEGDRWVLEAE